MGHHGSWYMRLLALVSIASLVGASATAAQEAAPHGRPGDVNGWRVADERELDIDGELISLSPDGQWIAGLGSDSDFCVWDIASLDPACTSASLPIARESMAWAPDSSAVAFSLDFARFFAESDIFVFDIDTGKLANLTDDGVDDVSLESPRTEAGPLLIDLFPTWSLDSKELTFGRTDWSAETLTTTLMTVSVDGGEPTELLTLETNYPFLVSSPMRWLESGSLLYTSWPADLDDPDAGLWIYEPGGDNVQILKGTSADDYPVPLATDVYEDNGKTVVLGFSALLNAELDRDRDRSIGFALDLETGDTASLEEVVGIDNTDAEIDERTLIFAPARMSPDGSTLILGISQLGPGTLAIASTETGEPPVSLDIEPKFQPFWAFQGYTWASNDTILVPLAEGPVVLLTLERSAEATPVAPCSCTPHPAAEPASSVPLPGSLIVAWHGSLPSAPD